MKMLKKTIVYLLCFMVAVTMMPVFAFATEQDSSGNPSGQTEQNSEMTEEQITPENGEQNLDITEEQMQIATEKQPSEAVVTKDERLGLGEFMDNGSEYSPDNDLYTSNRIRIYVLYIHRASGSWSSSDRYGDAILVESNGKFLLMDTSTNTPFKNSISVRTSSLVKTLKNIGVRDLDVYISHMHGDHTGGLKDVCNNFNVEHVFLPDIETCEKYITPDVRKSIDEIYREKTNDAKAANPNTQIVYLTPSFRTPRAVNAVNEFNVGAAKCTVIGPVGTYSIAEFASQEGNCGSKEGHYLNNCSLSTIIECGGFKYITNGDMETKEAIKMAGKYGDELNSDLMKVSHHGLKTLQTSAYISKVTPMWSVAQNHGYSSSSTSASFGLVGKYGYLYRAASRKKNLIVDVQDNAVRMFVDNNNNGVIDEEPLKGWVKGGSHYQYYNKSGYICTGWNWLNGTAYYMSKKSGFKLTGSHIINGVKVKFSSSGKLISHSKPAKVQNRSIKSYDGQIIEISWKKAYRASQYQVYRATSKNGTYSFLCALPSEARSFSDSGLTERQTYYYKVRAIRYIAGATLYGSFSSVKYIKAK